MAQTYRKWFTASGIDWIFPELCANCSAPLLPNEIGICNLCLGKLSPTFFHLSPQENEAYYRLRSWHPIQGALSAFWYHQDSPLRRIIRAAKYHNRPDLLRHLGRYYATWIKQETPHLQPQVLLPMPLHPHRLRQRTYNQAEWLARGIAEVLHVPVWTHVWKRRLYSLSQTKKTAQSRWQTLQNAFSLEGTVPSPCWAVDDILTTGATLSAALSVFPPQIQLWAVTIGITPRRT